MQNAKNVFYCFKVIATAKFLHFLSNIICHNDHFQWLKFCLYQGSDKEVINKKLVRLY